MQRDSGSQSESHKCHALTNRGELRLRAPGRCAPHFARNRLANESLGSIARGRIVRLCGAQSTNYLLGPWCTHSVDCQRTDPRTECFLANVHIHSLAPSTKYRLRFPCPHEFAGDFLPESGRARCGATRVYCEKVVLPSIHCASSRTPSAPPKPRSRTELGSRPRARMASAKCSMSLRMSLWM